MFPPWFPYQPVNFSQDILVTHKWMRSQPSPAASLHPTGRAGKGWLWPQLLSHPISQGCVQTFPKKNPCEAKGGCSKTFPGQFLPSFLFPASPSRDGQEWEQEEGCGEEEGQAGREGACCPQLGACATGAFWSLRLLCPARWREDMACVVGSFLADPTGRMSGAFEQWQRNCPGWDAVTFTSPVSQQLFLCSDPRASSSLSSPAGLVWRRCSSQWFIPFLLLPVL